MKSAAVLSLLVLLGACGRDATVYPSLARRPIESIDLSRPPAAKEAPLVADRALDARIAGFRQDLERIASGFDAAAARAGQLAGAAAARRVGSEAWLDAQTALGALDDWRAQTTDLAGRIDAAASERAAQLAPPYPALEGIQQAAAAEAERQDAARRPIQDALPAA